MLSCSRTLCSFDHSVFGLDTQLDRNWLTGHSKYCNLCLQHENTLPLLVKAYRPLQQIT